MKTLLLIAVASAIVNNVVLSQFLGICPFLGVSKKTETAAGMGGAVIFVITIASFVTALIYKFILTPLDIYYVHCILFFLFIFNFSLYFINIMLLSYVYLSKIIFLSVSFLFTQMIVSFAIQKLNCCNLYGNQCG